MGNCTSLESKHQNDICAICNQNIDIQKLLMCVKCNISLHESCYDNAPKIINDDTNYNKCTKCPLCGCKGCIGKFPSINSK